MNDGWRSLIILTLIPNQLLKSLAYLLHYMGARAKGDRRVGVDPVGLELTCESFIPFPSHGFRGPPRLHTMHLAEGGIASQAEKGRQSEMASATRMQNPLLKSVGARA